MLLKRSFELISSKAAATSGQMYKNRLHFAVREVDGRTKQKLAAKRAELGQAERLHMWLAGNRRLVRMYTPVNAWTT